MKIIFFGSSRFVLPIITVLHKNFDLQLVVTTEQKLTDAVPAFCAQSNIPFLSVSTFEESILQDLRKIGAHVGILACFGLILSEKVLSIFPKGILNIHPSLLPRYRGATPVQSTILNGDIQTGVTIIKLDNQMDHGPILEQVKEPVLHNDTTETLQSRLFLKGAKELIKIIPDYISGNINLRDQIDNEATYTKRMLTRSDGFFESDNPPSKEDLDRRIRAYYPWPAVWTELRIKNSAFAKASADKHESRIKFLPGADGKILLQVEGKKAMSVKDFLNGYPDLREEIKRILSI